MIVVASLQNRGARRWDRNTMGDTEAGLEAVSPGMERQLLAAPTRPITAGPIWAPLFAGVKVSLDRIVSNNIIPLPRTPAKIIASRSKPLPQGGPAVMPIRAAVIPSALVGVESTAPWYEYMN